MTTPTHLTLTHITKHYPAVLANDDFTLSVTAGKIHTILGENCAGKSTLMKIIYGVVKPDSGSVQFNGESVYIANPHSTHRLSPVQLKTQSGQWYARPPHEPIRKQLPSQFKCIRGGYAPRK